MKDNNLHFKNATNGPYSGYSLVHNVNDTTSITLDHTNKNILFAGKQHRNRVYSYNTVARNLIYYENSNTKFVELAIDFLTGNLYYISQGESPLLFNKTLKK